MNTRSRTHTLAALRLVTLSAVVFLAGCPPSTNGTATIRYEQLGACNGYQEGNTVVSAGPNAAYVLFKINNIDNRNGKINFPYDPGKVFVNGSQPRAHVDSTLMLAQKIGKLGTTATMVPAGTDLPHNGYAVVVVQTATSPDPQLEANATNYFLAYEPGSNGLGVLLDKKNAGQTQYQGARDCLSKPW
jgi:hypothetical protein